MGIAAYRLGKLYLAQEKSTDAAAYLQRSAAKRQLISPPMLSENCIMSKFNDNTQAEEIPYSSCRSQRRYYGYSSLSPWQAVFSSRKNSQMLLRTSNDLRQKTTISPPMLSENCIKSNLTIIHRLRNTLFKLPITKTILWV